MTLKDIIKVAHHDKESIEQGLLIYPRGKIPFKCNHKDFDLWGSLADCEVIEVRAMAWNHLMILVETPADQEEDPQIPGQMDISDYGIEGG